MKTIDLTKGNCSLNELLELAKSETVLIRSSSGDDFVLEQADELDREAAMFGSNEKFMSFLNARSEETDDISIQEILHKKGM